MTPPLYDQIYCVFVYVRSLTNDQFRQDFLSRGRPLRNNIHSQDLIITMLWPSNIYEVNVSKFSHFISICTHFSLAMMECEGTCTEKTRIKSGVQERRKMRETIEANYSRDYPRIHLLNNTTTRLLASQQVVQLTASAKEQQCIRNIMTPIRFVYCIVITVTPTYCLSS